MKKADAISTLKLENLAKSASKLTLTEWFGYSGLLPFIAALVFYWVDADQAVALFSAYSVLILAFMAGGCWGVAQHQGTGRQTGEESGEAEVWSPDVVSLSVSIGVFLVGAFVWWFRDLVSIPYCLLLLAACYLALFALERAPLFLSAYSSRYRRMRLHLTATVTSFHLIMWAIVTWL